MDVLVVDVGGTRVKMMATGAEASRHFDSGKHLTPEMLVKDVVRLTADWHYDVISVGYPGPVEARGPSTEPGNLADGWVGFDFESAFGRPVRVVNDAALQALGAYDGGRMLFLGLGTGLGSALVTEMVLVPLELGCLPYEGGGTVVEHLGRDGLERLGKTAWRLVVNNLSAALRKAFLADYIVLGGGNAVEVDPLPEHTRRGGNDDAFAGGFRLWEEIVEPHDRRPLPVWRVVR